MKKTIEQYHLMEGLAVAIFFPSVFVLSDSTKSNVFSHFISSFIIIFCLWFTNFFLIDFKSSKIQSSKTKFIRVYAKPMLSFLIAPVIYISIGLLLDKSGSLLSVARGNWGGSLSSWIYLCFKIFLFNALIILIKYLYDNKAEKRKIALENEILKRENINALHESLKQQVNPHFLFNSLNTLKSLTKQNPQLATHFIDEMSSVYRYMLLHQDKKDVTVGEEIDFLKSYLYLLKIRFGEAIQTKIDLPETFLKNPMPPNTLQMLIENAVKHNSLSLKKPLSISISVNQNHLTVQNNLQPKKQITAASSYFGLSNISNRYLLSKGKDIIIEKTETSFSVSLPLT